MIGQRIGIKLADGTFYPILEEGKPAQKKLELTTAQDAQESVQVNLYRENSENDYEFIDTLLIDNIDSNKSGDATLSLIITLDENNRLSASISDDSKGINNTVSSSIVDLNKSFSSYSNNFDIDHINEESFPEIDFSSSESSDDDFNIDDINFDDLDLDRLSENEGKSSWDMLGTDIEIATNPSGLNDFSYLQHNNSKLKIVLIIVLVLAILGLVYFLFFKNSKSDVEKQETSQTVESVSAETKEKKETESLNEKSSSVTKETVSDIKTTSGEDKSLQNSAKEGNLPMEKVGESNDNQLNIKQDVIKEENHQEAMEDKIIVSKSSSMIVPDIPKKSEEAINQKSIKYVIKWGDTLWDISESYYKNPRLYMKIATANNIKNPDFIRAGTTIVIPF